MITNMMRDPPVIGQAQNQLDTMLLGGAHDRIEALEAVLVDRDILALEQLRPICKRQNKIMSTRYNHSPGRTFRLWGLCR